MINNNYSDSANFGAGADKNTIHNSLEELVSYVAKDQRWQNEEEACANFNLFAAAYAVAAAEDEAKNLDLFDAYLAAEAESSYLADLDGLLAAVEATSNDWEEEQEQAAAVELLGPTEDEADLGFKFPMQIAA